MAKRMKEKTARLEAEKDKRPHAVARHIRIAPGKVRVVLDTVRGKSVNEALDLLSATPKAASDPVTKLIKSAAANAEHNLDLPRVDLFVAEIYADEGPTLKRAMPRAKGRSFSIMKRTSHITVILDSRKQEVK